MKRLLLFLALSMSMLLGQELVSVQPNQAPPGADFWMEITGNGTNFVASDTTGGMSVVTGVHLMSPSGEELQATSFQALSETILHANFQIPMMAAMGPRHVVVEMDGGDDLTLENGFHVSPIHPIVSVDPNSGTVGSDVWVTITGGEGAHFQVSDTTGVQNNVVSVHLEDPINELLIHATSFTSQSASVLEAMFELREDVLPGTYDVVVTMHPPHGVAHGPGAFQVLESTTSIGEEILPKTISLHQNYPNPFNPTTNLSFDLAKSSVISLKIFDINGNQVSVLKEGLIEAGKHNITWNGTNLDGLKVPSGIYIYQLKTDSFISNKRMVLMK